MRRLAWKAGFICVALAAWTALIAALAPPARSAEGWTWPVRGRVITQYSNDDANPYAGGMHRGIDIAAPVGTPVVAARSGEVTYAGDLGYSGLTVAVRSADGRYVTSYLHLSAVSVRRGEAIGSGARLGAVGTTGRRSADEPHLHFGVRLAGDERHYVDPLSLLPPLPAAETAQPAGPAPVAAPVAPRVAPAPVAVAAPRRVRQPRRHPVRQPAVRPGRARVPVAGPVRPAVVTASRPARAAHHLSHRDRPVRPPVTVPRHRHEPSPAPRPHTARTSAPAQPDGRNLGPWLLWGGIGVVLLALAGPAANRARRVRGSGRARTRGVGIGEPGTAGPAPIRGARYVWRIVSLSR
jgi:Peptidase family M23